MGIEGKGARRFARISRARAEKSDLGPRPIYFDRLTSLTASPFPVPSLLSHSLFPPNSTSLFHDGVANHLSTVQQRDRSRDKLCRASKVVQPRSLLLSRPLATQLARAAMGIVVLLLGQPHHRDGHHVVCHARGQSPLFRVKVATKKHASNDPSAITLTRFETPHSSCTSDGVSHGWP